MLKKAINYVIQAKRKDKKLEKDLEGQGCGWQLKIATSTPLNPKSKVQNQGQKDWV